MDDKEAVGDKAPSVLDITSIDIYLLLGLFVNVLGDQAWQIYGASSKACDEEGRERPL